MDRAPDYNDGLMWVFVMGQPSDELMASFGGLLGVGNFDWVIVPMKNAPATRVSDGDIAVIGLG